MLLQIPLPSRPFPVHFGGRAYHTVEPGLTYGGCTIMNGKVWKGFVAGCALAMSAVWTGQAGAQTSEVKEKPALYTYVADWNIPRKKWADMEKSTASDQKILDKALADG